MSIILLIFIIRRLHLSQASLRKLSMERCSVSQAASLRPPCRAKASNGCGATVLLRGLFLLLLTGLIAACTSRQQDRGALGAVVVASPTALTQTPEPVHTLTGPERDA